MKDSRKQIGSFLLQINYVRFCNKDSIDWIVYKFHFAAHFGKNPSAQSS